MDGYGDWQPVGPLGDDQVLLVAGLTLEHALCGLLRPGQYRMVCAPPWESCSPCRCCTARRITQRGILPSSLAYKMVSRIPQNTMTGGQQLWRPFNRRLAPLCCNTCQQTGGHFFMLPGHTGSRPAATLQPGLQTAPGALCSGRLDKGVRRGWACGTCTQVTTWLRCGSAASGCMGIELAVCLMGTLWLGCRCYDVNLYVGAVNLMCAARCPYSHVRCCAV